jgi:glyoxylase-like metal-dependent hydrolase (beta-lactamase superfamily II)/8-oxo-dGTP pyrophosphatase MutT (NUDIX family)
LVLDVVLFMGHSASDSSVSSAPAQRPPRPSATLVVVRDAPAGMEVLLLKRSESGDHNSGAWVFPGGGVDAADGAAESCSHGLDDAQASRRLGLDRGGLAFHVAAVRECFEEAGLLFACDAEGALVGAAQVQQLVDWRDALHSGARSLAQLCGQHGLRLALDRLAYLSHWVTPLGRPKRFDTRFFVAEAPQGHEALHDATELVEHRWLRPADALAQGGVLKLMTPTVKTLESLARFDGVPSLMRWARSPREVPLTMPRIGTGSQGPRPVTPDEPAFAELGRIDPAGHGHGRCEIEPGAAVRLSPRVVRVTANNGSVMTGPGTNTYLVGGGPRNEWAAIDPGPHDPSHVAAIVAAAPGPIRWIFVTHTHQDHSPAAALLKARTGAALLGRIAAHPEWQDRDFAPDRALHGGERIAIDEGVTLRAVHTPGHASNHLCYVLEEEKTLFAGDHVMQQSTVVINPPDGDMAAYLASLRALLDEDLDWIAPGHGFLMAEPTRVVEAIVAHRLKREAKVVDALRDLGPSGEDALLAQVYDDVPQRLHGMALRSLKAHLAKLEQEGRARRDGGARWGLAT